jgi:arylsulfatase A-like enzyme
MAHRSRQQNTYAINGIRVGRWKYLTAEQVISGYAVEPDREATEELFDLEEDLGETTNLATEHPEIVKRLRERMQDWWRDANG